MELPINNRREEMFAAKKAAAMMPQQDYPSNLGGFQSQQLMLGGVPADFRDLYSNQQPQQQMPFGLQGPNPYSMGGPGGFNQPLGGGGYGQQAPMMAMDEEYQKMLMQYQKAFQEAIDIKNHYMEQVMRMRENVIKEREDILQYEGMKMQQNMEIQNLKAVVGRLGELVQQQNTNQSYFPQKQLDKPQMNPHLQGNLDILLQKQQQDIMRLSQSGVNFKFPQVQQPPQVQTKQQQQKGARDYNQAYINPHAQNDTNILEQSLSSDTKFVFVPQNKVQQNQANLVQTWKQDQMQQEGVPNGQVYGQTLTQSLAGTSQFLNHQAQQTPTKPFPGNKTLGAGASRPQTSQPPETIPELPKEEDDQVNASKQSLPQQRRVLEEEDFNSRDSSLEKIARTTLGATQNQPILEKQSSLGTIQQNAITSTNPLGNTSTIKDNMNQIERLLRAANQQAQNLEISAQTNPQVNEIPAQTIPKKSKDPLSPSNMKYPQSSQSNVPSHQNKTQEKFHQNAGATGSSFYNATMQMQKKQEQDQMDELQKQLMRIYAPNDTSNDIVGSIIEQTKNPIILQTPQLAINQQQRQQDAYNSQMIALQNKQQNIYVNPLLKATQQERVNQLTMNSEEKDLFHNSNINIADSLTETRQMHAIIDKANQKYSSNGFQQNQYYAQEIVDESKEEHEYDVYQQNDGYQESEAQEIAMNDRPTVSYGQSGLYESSKYQKIAAAAFESQSQDVWNDPELVPPPVVMMNEDEDDYFNPQYNEPSQANPYAYGFAGQSMQEGDGTLQNLQMFSPPSDDNHFNLGTYEEGIAGASQTNLNMMEESQQEQEFQQFEVQEQERVPSAFQRQYSSQQQHPHYLQTPQYLHQSNHGDLISEKSLSRREMAAKLSEVQKAILEATSKANNLFENSDQFKFKLHGIKEQNTIETPNNGAAIANFGGAGQPPLSQGRMKQQTSRKNIKTVDPFKNADSKLQTTYMSNQQQQMQEESKDEEILGNLDKMIENLEQQKNSNAQERYSFQKLEPKGRPFSGIPMISGPKQDQEISKSNKKFRPISAVDQDQPKIGKYTQMALQSNDKKLQQNKSLGRFTQMALQTIEKPSDQLIHEVQMKYNDGASSQYQPTEKLRNSHHITQQQVILRPVSGRSGSSRYVDGVKNRSSSRHKQQQMFYEDESEEMGNSNAGGFNIGLADEAQEENNQ